MQVTLKLEDETFQFVKVLARIEQITPELYLENLLNGQQAELKKKAVLGLGAKIMAEDRGLFDLLADN